MKLYDKYNESGTSELDQEAGRGDYDTPPRQQFPSRQQYQPREQQYQSSSERKQPLHRSKLGKFGWSVWPAFEDPAQPKFCLEVPSFKSPRNGQWETRRSFFYHEAVDLYKTLHNVIRWCCAEAGHPMPGTEDSEILPPPSSDAPQTAQLSQYREAPQPAPYQPAPYRETGAVAGDYRQNPYYQSQSYPAPEWHGGTGAIPSEQRPRIPERPKEDTPF